ncbi:glycoside hydrolase family 3 protein [Solitalea lacus]|uniref:glycoside hydrolase family 3 protein n=1 Tax=Solitalea lacus TaxID=2911172 RepID=UPI001EDA271B|nr:glycoside hydrolase family 3 N-terminal domain-containing protein [Solitalea lacus]UKJ07459.1 glycoside hydrolase family 3 [Solitalea lacus]
MNLKIKLIGSILTLISIAPSLQAQIATNSTKSDLVSSIQHPNAWVDSVFKKMKRKERIAQLFMVPVYSNHPKEKRDSVTALIKRYQAGGIITFQGGPVRNALLLNEIQKKLKVPALVATDGEWGLAMRLDSTVSYPFQMTLGAIQNNDLIYKVGQQMAAQFKRAGIQMNFAPVVDVNNNINNPVINFRSFGENKYNVAQKGIAIMKGMQDGGLLATAKHFPGHGDTDVDSHYDLPQLKFSRERLDSLEMYPFKQIINAGIGGVMVAHMNIPTLDNTPNLPSTLSRPIVSDLLQKDLQFKGLVFTDAMNMKGVVKYHPKGEAAVLAMTAGNDMLEMVENLPASIKAVRKAIRKKQISRKEVDARCKKILAAKYWIGLNNYQPVYLPNLTQDLNPEDATLLNTQLAEAAATTIIKPGDSVLKLSDKILIISIGTGETTLFQKTISASVSAATLTIPKDADATKLESVRKQLNNYSKIIIGVHDFRARPRATLDYNSGVIDFISELIQTNKAYVCLMANAYTMASLKTLDKAKGLWVLYENSKYTEQAAAKVILGELSTSGKLPVTVNTTFKAGIGL